MAEPALFKVRARADPQTLPRLINYVARLGLIPSHVSAIEADGNMDILIEQTGLRDHQAAIIAEKMRASVLVEAVELRTAEGRERDRTLRRHDVST